MFTQETLWRENRLRVKQLTELVEVEGRIFEKLINGEYPEIISDIKYDVDAQTFTGENFFGQDIEIYKVCFDLYIELNDGETLYVDDAQIALGNLISADRIMELVDEKIEDYIAEDQDDGECNDCEECIFFNICERKSIDEDTVDDMEEDEWETVVEGTLTDEGWFDYEINDQNIITEILSDLENKKIRIQVIKEDQEDDDDTFELWTW